MMSADEKDDFKVVDRRSSSGVKDEPGKKTGEGFVMKDAPEAAPTQPGELDFSTLVFSFATGALINLGLAPDPATKKTHKNVEMAKQNIEILTILKEKTKGNLTPDESTLLENLLTEIRLRFVEATK